MLHILIALINYYIVTNLLAALQQSYFGGDHVTDFSRKDVPCLFAVHNKQVADKGTGPTHPWVVFE